MATKQKQRDRKQRKSVATSTQVAVTQQEIKVTRHVLMLKAKDRGIKNFRVLNKAELEEVLAEGVTAERIQEIVSGAVARWKAGWGTKKK